MTVTGAQPAPQNRKPTPEEWEHIIKHHIGVEISTADGTATVAVVGECGEPGCPTPYVVKCRFCHRPPC